MEFAIFHYKQFGDHTKCSNTLRVTISELFSYCDRIAIGLGKAMSIFYAFLEK